MWAAAGLRGKQRLQLSATRGDTETKEGFTMSILSVKL
jgi:hypothetical protein